MLRLFLISFGLLFTKLNVSFNFDVLLTFLLQSEFRHESVDVIGRWHFADLHFLGNGFAVLHIRHFALVVTALGVLLLETLGPGELLHLVSEVAVDAQLHAVAVFFLDELELSS